MSHAVAPSETSHGRRPLGLTNCAQTGAVYVVPDEVAPDEDESECADFELDEPPLRDKPDDASEDDAPTDEPPLGADVLEADEVFVAPVGACPTVEGARVESPPEPQAASVSARVVTTMT